MQRIIFAIGLLIKLSFSAFVGVGINNSRLQTENYVYNSGGLIGSNIEFGVFNDTNRMLDYYSSVAIVNFGYTHTYLGKVQNSEFYEFELRPIIIEILYDKIYSQVEVSFGYSPFSRGISKEIIPLFFGYGYNIGYKMKNKFSVGLTANYHHVGWRSPINEADHHFITVIGGIGLQIRYEIP